MASKITAINAYRPRIDLEKTIFMQTVVEYIADRTGLNKGDLQIALSELSSTVEFFNKQGMG